MQIYIKTLSGTKRNLTVDTLDSIDVIKTLLQEKEGIQKNQIRLIFGGNPLVDTQLISDTAIIAGSVVHMVIQLRGG